MDGISGLRSSPNAQSLAELRKAGTANKPETAQQPSFSDMLNRLSDSQNNTDALIRQLAAGEEVDIHQVMISAEETDIQFRVALAIRDKLVEAYREVMRMNV